MRRHFYGVYLDSTPIATILDLIRFISEPDSIRFAHITLRGPYYTGLNRYQLYLLNQDRKDREIHLLEPLRFFTNMQSTVAIAVDLRRLADLVYKPDFPKGVPHITLYDGGDRDFAEQVADLVEKYSWRNTLTVGLLQEVTPKKPLEQEFVPFFTNFERYFNALVGDSKLISAMRTTSAHQRLDLIQSILERCSVNDTGTTRAAPARVTPDIAAAAYL